MQTQLLLPEFCEVRCLSSVRPWSLWRSLTIDDFAPVPRPEAIRVDLGVRTNSREPFTSSGTTRRRPKSAVRKVHYRTLWLLQSGFRHQPARHGRLNFKSQWPKRAWVSTILKTMKSCRKDALSSSYKAALLIKGSVESSSIS